MTRDGPDSPRQALTVPSQAQMFEAIGRRDTTSDGLFVYGVVTTGVFCRPSCASRPARAEREIEALSRVARH